MYSLLSAFSSNAKLQKMNFVYQTTPFTMTHPNLHVLIIKLLMKPRTLNHQDTIIDVFEVGTVIFNSIHQEAGVLVTIVDWFGIDC
jgi:hypothetical protein